MRGTEGNKTLKNTLLLFTIKILKLETLRFIVGVVVNKHLKKLMFFKEETQFYRYIFYHMDIFYCFHFFLSNFIPCLITFFCSTLFFIELTRCDFFVIKVAAGRSHFAVINVEKEMYTWAVNKSNYSLCYANHFFKRRTLKL